MYNPYSNRDDAYPQSLTLPRPMRVVHPQGRPASSPSASGLRSVDLDQIIPQVTLLTCRNFEPYYV